MLQDFATRPAQATKELHSLQKPKGWQKTDEVVFVQTYKMECKARVSVSGEARRWSG